MKIPIIKRKDLQKTLRNLQEHGESACTLCDVILQEWNWDG
jgi:hypothetical protein